MFGKPRTRGELQYIDEKSNLIFPWYTGPALSYISTLSYRDWEVFEWGCGCSTVWYSFNCRSVIGIEPNRKWIGEIEQYLGQHGRTNFFINHIEVPDGRYSRRYPLHPNKGRYLDFIKVLNKQFDIICIDGSYRQEALVISEVFVKRGGLLIFDNYEQKTSGYPVLEVKDYFNQKYRVQVFQEPTYPKWKTAVWHID